MTVNIQDAREHLSRLLEEAIGGEEVVIVKAGKPVARIVPYGEMRPSGKLDRLSENYHEPVDCWSPESAFKDSGENPPTGAVADDAP